MLITRTSMFTGKTHTININCTEKQLKSYYEDGLLIQDAFPNLSASAREFIKTGVTEEEWNETFGNED